MCIGCWCCFLCVVTTLNNFLKQRQCWFVAEIEAGENQLASNRHFPSFFLMLYNSFILFNALGIHPLLSKVHVWSVGITTTHLTCTMLRAQVLRDSHVEHYILCLNQLNLILLKGTWMFPTYSFKSMFISVTAFLHVSKLFESNGCTIKTILYSMVGSKIDFFSFPNLTQVCTQNILALSWVRRKHIFHSESVHCFY